MTMNKARAENFLNRVGHAFSWRYLVAKQLKMLIQ